MTIKINKYKKMTTLLLVGFLASLFSFLSIKDKQQNYSLTIGEKAMADVPSIPNTPQDPDLLGSDGGDSDSDGTGGDGADSA